MVNKNKKNVNNKKEKNNKKEEIINEDEIDIQEEETFNIVNQNIMDIRSLLE
eukprot:jgi/Orpsp1_1/1186947/evm.model.d7180000054318.1